MLGGGYSASVKLLLSSCYPLFIVFLLQNFRGWTFVNSKHTWLQRGQRGEKWQNYDGKSECFELFWLDRALSHLWISRLCKTEIFCSSCVMICMSCKHSVHVLVHVYEEPCSSIPLPIMPETKNCAKLEHRPKHSLCQVNQSLRFNHAWAQYRLPSVSVP